jgi:homoserine kinase
MTERSVLIRVPATVGNFGGATGCAALALDAALNVRASTRGDGRVTVRYFGENGERVPRDTRNLAVRAMQSALEHREIPFLGVEFEMYGSVPVAVGLGSSTAAVWAGLLAADRLYRLNFGEKELFDLASELEPRSDNLRAAWLGGFIASFQEGPSVLHRVTSVPGDLLLTVVIPEIGSVENRASGGLNLTAKDRVACLDRAALLSGLLSSPESTEGIAGAFAGVPEKTVPGLDEALRLAAPGEVTFVCGSGPSVGILTHGAAAESTAKAVTDCLAWHGVASSVAHFRASNSGARDWNASGTDIRTAPPVGRDLTQRSPLLV